VAGPVPARVRATMRVGTSGSLGPSWVGNLSPPGAPERDWPTCLARMPAWLAM